jgi:hypothetical protein
VADYSQYSLYITWPIKARPTNFAQQQLTCLKKPIRASSSPNSGAGGKFQYDGRGFPIRAHAVTEPDDPAMEFTHCRGLMKTGPEVVEGQP